jgi:crotonobetaine/carnitine-CoA ligase
MRKEMLESFVLGDVLRSQAQVHRRQTFLKFRDGEVTYGEVDAAADRMARRLAGAGIGRGDHVGLMLPNCADFVHLVFALARLGAVAVPINIAYRGELLRHVLDSSDSTRLIIDGPYAERIVELAERLPKLGGVIVRDAAANEVLLDRLGKPARDLSALPEDGDGRVEVPVGFADMQAIMYTSGTTGPSKGAMVPHALALTCAYDSLDFLDRWGKTIYCPLPLFHAAALWDGMLSALLGGGSIAIVERFSASRFWDDVRRFDAQVCMSVFSMIPIC